MGRNKLDTSDLEVKESMHWREYFQSGMRRGIPTQPSKEMLVTHVDEATGVPTYQGLKIQHIVSDGRGDEKTQYLVEVLYDNEYIQDYLYSLLSYLGLISNNIINRTLWDKWLNPDSGKVWEYGQTEGSRKQDEEDRINAKTMAALVEGTTVEEWLETIRAKRLRAIEAQAKAETSNGTETANKSKTRASTKS